MRLVEDIGQYKGDARLWAEKIPPKHSRVHTWDISASEGAPLANIEYYKDDVDLPIYSDKTLDLNEIFKIYLTKEIEAEKMTKIKPTGVTVSGTFVLNESEIGLAHSYDLEADLLVAHM